MGGRETDSVTPLVEPLTRRERQVLALQAQGFTAPEIAEKLTLALSSVKFHIQNVYGKLGANTKRQAITRAGELGLLGTLEPAVMAAAQFGHSEAAEAQPEPGESPFKGLRYFDEPDAALFFGREALVARLAARLAAQAAPGGKRQPHFLAIVGASGSGKSSIVRAGLIPALRAASADGPRFEPIHILTPTAHPLEALAVCLTRGAQSITTATTLMDDLARDDRALHMHFHKLSFERGAPRAPVYRSDSHLLLVVDQFEEVFTLCRGESERLAFIRNLIRAAAPEVEGPATVLITLRADFYSACGPYPELRDVLASQQEYIGPMSPGELRQAIELPARAGRWEFAPGLVDLILRDVGDEPGALPLLSHALLETWQHRRGRTLTLESYAEAGRVQGAIATTAEAVFQTLAPDEQGLARSVFLRLTELGEGTQDTRRRVSLAELIRPTGLDPSDGSPPANDSMATVLKTLSDARLITTDAGVVEVAHEALIREWPTLRSWLTDDRDGLRLHRRLTEAAQEWESLERDPSELYRGLRLVQTLEWAGSHAQDLNPLENDFLEASQALAEREAAEREAQRQGELQAARDLAEAQSQRAAEQAQAAGRLRGRNRVITAIGGLALLAAIVAAFFGIQSGRNAAVAQVANTQSASNLGTAQAASTEAIAQRDEVQRQSQFSFAHQLAGQAVAIMDSDYSLALLLGTEALGIVDTPLVRSTMRLIFKSSPHLLTFLRGHTTAVSEVAFSPNGQWLATAAQDGAVRVLDVATRQLAGPVVSLDSSFAPVFAFSPDGATLAAGGADASLRVVTVADGQPLGQQPAGSEVHVTALAFSPDGKTLAAASPDNTIRLWEVATGRPITLPLAGHTLGVTALAFSPDGETLASSSTDTSVRLWDTATGVPRGEPLLGHQQLVVSVAFSPDGRLLASGSSDAGILLWDLAGEAPARLGRLSGHTGSVTSLAFSPDSQLLLSGSADGTLILWNPATLAPVGPPLTGHQAAVTSVAFSPDGQTLASASDDRTAALWRVSGDLTSLATDDWQARACSMAGRNLTAAEWDSYLAGRAYHKTCEQWPEEGDIGLESVPATSIQFFVGGIAFDKDLNLYVGNCGGSFNNVTAIDKIDPAGRLTVFAGGRTFGYSGDGGPAIDASIGCAFGMAFDASGDLFFADDYAQRIRRVDRNGIVTTVVGSGPLSEFDLQGNFLGAIGERTGDGGPALEAWLQWPNAIAFDTKGNLYISSNYTIRKVDANGIITRVAGNGQLGFSGDGGPATEAMLNDPKSIALDDAGNLYIADWGNSRVRKVDPQGIITTIAGTGELGALGDGGPATAAQLSEPAGLAFDREGNLYVSTGSDAFLSDHRIRRIDRDGIITTVVGAGRSDFTGDGGLALLATIRYPTAIAFDSAGRMYFVDSGNNRVRRVDTNGIITTIAGGAP